MLSKISWTTNFTEKELYEVFKLCFNIKPLHGGDVENIINIAKKLHSIKSISLDISKRRCLFLSDVEDAIKELKLNITKEEKIPFMFI